MKFYYYGHMHDYLLAIVDHYGPTTQAIVKLRSIRRRWIGRCDETPDCIPNRVAIEKNRWIRFVPNSKEDDQERTIRLSELEEIEKVLALFPFVDRKTEDGAFDPINRSESQLANEESRDPETKALELLYENYSQNKKLSDAERRGLEAVRLCSQGKSSKEIFSILQPEDTKQKDPERAVRKWKTKGKEIAQKFGLPPLPSPSDET